MSDEALTLAGRRIRLRALMAAQRKRIGTQLAATDLPGTYPRSLTMRWLMQEPRLVAAAVSKVIGRRAAMAVPIMLSVARLLRTLGDASKSRSRR
ncbi:MAG TPA: hypothetical protein VM240_00010 [Verrucomicrobiae bacterium]|nr:hypothetical protein [Verrucomicrobiae bacterium]